jgi:hypothetical protein
MLVLIAVAAVAFLYVRATKQARREWLTRLDLPGRWIADISGEQTEAWVLTLQGSMDGGDFVLREGARESRGEWQMVGHTLTLRGSNMAQSFDLHYFKAGSIGLQNAAGVRRVLTKGTDNVVRLHSQSKGSRSGD